MGGRETHAIRMEGIDKTFGSVRANRGASLEVKPGEIHALVGENGAGKSTLMKILGGLQKPDAGKMEVNGRDVTGWSTSDAIAAGIGVVHQHFMLVPTLTVAENIVLGMEPRERRALRLREGRSRRGEAERGDGTCCFCRTRRCRSFPSVKRSVSRSSRHCSAARRFWFSTSLPQCFRRLK